MYLPGVDPKGTIRGTLRTLCLVLGLWLISSGVARAQTSVTLTDPVPSQTSGTPGISGTKVLRANASDATNGIAQVEFFLVTPTGPSSIQVDSSAPYEGTLNTTLFPDGDYEVYAEATNGIGGKVRNPASASPAFTVTIDQSPPVNVQLTNPTSGTLTGPILMQATASDPHTGICTMEFYVDGILQTRDTVAPFQTTVTPSDGVHAFSATAVNCADKRTNAPSFNLTVDNSPPSATLTSPTAGSTVSSTINLQATATDNLGLASARFYLDGVLRATVNGVGPSFVTTFDTTQFGDGSHTFAVEAVDQAGLVSPLSSRLATIDNTGPSVSSSSPGAGSVLSGTFNLTVSASDALSGVNQVEFFINGVSQGTQLGAGPVFNFAFDSTTVANGSTSFFARATDGAGITANSSTVLFTVDNSAPTVNYNAPTSGFQGGTITMSATASDSESNISKVDFLIGNNRFGPASLSASTYTLSVNTNLVPDGVHLFTAEATNGANPGLVTTAPGTNLTVDNSAPVTNITAPSNGSVLTGTVTYSANATDAHSGITQVAFQVDGSTFQTDTSSPFDFGLNTASFADGPHTLRVRTTNGASLQTDSAQLSVTFDNNPPTTAITTPSNGAKVTGTFTATATASDGASGITSVEFQVDGSTFFSDAASPFTTPVNTTGLSLSDGSHTLSVIAHDGAGFSSTPVVHSITVDNSAPSVAITGPATATYCDTITVTATASDAHSGITQVQLLVDGATQATLTAAPFTFSLNTNLFADGAHQVEVRAFNGVGLSSFERKQLTFDNTPPTVSISSTSVPFLTQTTTFNATTSDPSTAITQVEFLIDGVVFTSATSSPVATVTLDTTTQSDGSHNFQARATNSIGKVATSLGIVRTIDNSPPTISFTAPSSGAFVSGNLTLQVSAQDPHSSLPGGVEFYRTTTSGEVFLGTDTSSPFTFVVDTNALGQGSHTFHAITTNGVGLSVDTTAGFPGPVTVMVDNSAPTVSVVQPSSGLYCGTVVLEASANDAESGISKVEWFADGGATPIASTTVGPPYIASFDSATLSDGGHTITARATNGSGVTANSAGVSITLDNSPAVTSLVSPANGALVKGNIALQANATDSNTGVSQLDFLVDGNPVGAPIMSPPFLVSSFDTTTLSDGSHTVQARSLNGAGKSGFSTATITVDNSVPTVSLTTPTGGILCNTVNFELSASDVHSGITQVQFLYDSSTLIATRTTTPFAQAIDTRTIPDGSHPFFATATNGTGLQGTSASFNILVDNSAPNLSVTTPLIGTQTGTFPFRATATDPHSTIQDVEFFVDNVLRATDTSTPYEATIDSVALGLTDGLHAIRVRTKNACGLVTQTSNANILIDNSGPSVALTAPASGTITTTSTLITATASDVHSGISRVEFLVDGVVIFTDSAAPFELTTNLTTFGDGAHTLQARSFNAINLSDVSNVVSFTTDASPPSVSITAPTSGPSPACGIFPFQASASDTHSGIKMVEFLIDGVLRSTDTSSPYEFSVDTSLLGLNGSHTFEARATNGVNLSSLTTQVVQVDGTQPVVSFTGPLTGPITGSVTLTATATDPDSGVAQVDFLIDGQLAGSTSITPYSLTTNTALLSAGTHTFQARAVGGGSCSNLSSAVVLQVDNLPPSVTLTSPTTDGNGPISLAATAIDTGTGISQVRFLVDTTVVATLPLPPFSVAFDTSSLADGSHTFAAEASDGVGLVTTDSRTIFIDNSAPTVSLVSPSTTTAPASTLALMPTPRDRVKAVENGTSLFLVGGTNGAGTSLGTLEQYTIGTNTWTSRPNMPTARASAFVARVGTKIFVAGGETAASTQTNVLEVYDIGAGTWSTATALPLARSRGVSYNVDGLLWTVGGRVGALASRETQVYDTAADTWSAGVQPQVARFDAAGALYGGKLYLFGGNSGSGPLNNAEVFNPQTQTWSFLAPMPVPDDGGVAHVVDRFIYVLGGSSKKILRFDPQLNTWTTEGDLVAPQSTLSGGVSLGEDLYLSGGTDSGINGTHRRFSFPAGQVLSGTVTFDANAADAQSPVTQVEFLVDGVVVAIDTTAPYSVSYNTTTATDGARVIQARATNSGGLNATSPSTNFFIQNASPTVSLTNPTAGPLGGTVDLQALASDPNCAIQTLEFLVDGGVVATDSTPPYSFNFQTTSLSPGNHNFQARGKNCLGSTSTTANLILQVDTSGPTVSMLTPLGPGFLAGGTTLQANATDTETGIQQVEFLLDGVVIGTDATAPYTLSYDSTTASDGSHDFQARAQNQAGLVSTSASNVVTVDNSPPVAGVTGPTGSVAGTFQVTGTATDPHSGIAQVAFTLDGTAIGTDLTAPYGVTVNSLSPILADGLHTAQATATNGSGLNTLTSQLTFIVDNSPPAVALTSPTAGPLTGTISLSGTAADPHSGIQTVQYSVDGLPVATSTSFPFSSTLNTATLSDGTHTFALQATNTVNLSAATGGVALVVDNSPPTVTLTSPTTGSVLVGSVTLTAAANDPHTSVTQVQFLIDGSVVGSDTTAPYELAFDTTTIASGNHTIQARAINSVGLTQDTPAATYSVGNPGPVDTTLGGDGEGGNGSDITPDNSVAADGVTTAPKLVTVRDAAGIPIAGVSVSLVSDRGSDTITPSSALTNAAGQASFAVASSQKGLSNFAFSVGGQLSQDTASTTFTNAAPVANAGVDRTVQPGNFQLDGSASSDVNSDPLTFTWSQTFGPLATLTNGASATPTVLALSAGTYTFQLVVNDGSVNSAADTVQITVQDLAPVSHAGFDTQVLGGSMVRLDGLRSSDANGDPLTFLWTPSPGNPAGTTVVNTTDSQPTVTFPTTPGVYSYSLVVNDGSQNSPSDSVSVTVQTTANQVPTADPGRNQVVVTNTLVQLDGTLSRDPDGTVQGFQWTEDSGNPSTGLLSSSTASQPTFTPTIPGIYKFRLAVTDNASNTSAPREVQVEVFSAATPPPIVSITRTAPTTGATVHPNTAVTLDASASKDPAGGSLFFSWSQIFPFAQTGLSTASSLTYTPLVAGDYVFEVQVTNGTSSRKLRHVVQVVPTGRNLPTVIPGFLDSAGNMSTNGVGISAIGNTVTLMSGASDPDSDPLTFTWEQVAGPPVLMSNPNAQNPSFVPGASGTYQFKVWVSDGSNTAVASVFVSVSGPGANVPVAGQAPTVSGATGSTVTLDGSSSSDADGGTLTHFWVQVSGPPVQLSNANSATPTFTPTQDGTYVFEHFVSDGTNVSSPGSTTVSIAAGLTGGTGGGTTAGGDGGSRTGGGCRSLPDANAPPLALLFWLVFLLTRMAGLRKKD